jgi:hypothetical protein
MNEKCRRGMCQRLFGNLFVRERLKGEVNPNDRVDFSARRDSSAGNRSAKDDYRLMI